MWTKNLGKGETNNCVRPVEELTWHVFAFTLLLCSNMCIFKGLPKLWHKATHISMLHHSHLFNVSPSKV
jgi:hypothetical protein